MMRVTSSVAETCASLRQRLAEAIVTLAVAKGISNKVIMDATINEAIEDLDFARSKIRNWPQHPWRFAAGASW